MTVDVDALLAPMVATHRSGANHTLEWRVRQLDTLLLMLTECEADFTDALYEDLRKERTEAMYSELGVVKREIQTFLRGLKGWMRPRRVSVPLAVAPSVCEVLSVPLSEPGVLVIGPFNYPVGLTLLATVGAFGGGNPVVLKPSEQCSAVSATFARVVPRYFEKGVFQVVEGGVEETTNLLKQHWGMIHFTGSERVGRIVQQAAAKTLSPTILELGGKSPVIIAEDCPDNMAAVCDRVIFGKLINSGQTCVAPDYALVHESKVEKFIENAIGAIEKHFGKDQKDSELGRIVSEAHAKRLIQLIGEVDDKVIYGGSTKCCLEDKFVAPTLVRDPPLECRLMKEEIFGPVLPVLAYSSDDDALSILAKMPATPLIMHVFTKSKTRYESFMRQCPSGMASMNDTMLSLFIPDFPFGGLGTSGLGVYKGPGSFAAFTHQKSSIMHPCNAAAESVHLGLRYHPHKGWKGKVLLLAVDYLPDIPVISTKALVGWVGLGLCVLHNGVGPCILQLADMLEATALFLRSWGRS